MTEIQISGHRTAQVSCERGDFTRDVRDGDVQGALADGAMHAIQYGHTVHELVTDDKTVTPYQEGR